MKIILFGRAEIDLGQHISQLKMIEEVIKRINLQQVLHIPFARSKATEVEWGEDWFVKDTDLGSISYLNAKKVEDIEKADDPLIFMSGGGGNVALLEGIKANPKLLELVQNAKYIIGESAGAKILGTYFRKSGDNENSELVKGLDIIKDTIIEPHYTERNRHGLLLKDLKESGLSYGIGIDCLTAIEFDLDKFPEKYTKIGNGLVEVKRKN